jgi:hypothetical protein
VRAFRKRYAITFPIAMDADGSFARVLEIGAATGTVNYPVTLFVDPRGYLYCDLLGSVGRAQLRYRVERFIAASAPEITVAPSPRPT